MTAPKRPTKKPKPIGRHPHAGHYAVVATFRVEAQEDKSGDLDLIEAYVRNRLGDRGDLTVHIRRIGVGGEASEMEGVVGPLAHTEDDLPIIRTARDQDTIETTRGRP